MFVVFIAGATATASGARAEGDPEKGRQIAIKHCSRCHVIPDHNPFGGIGSTPSFRGLSRIGDHVERFRTFYARRPHPVFVRVPGVPELTKLPSFVEPFIVRSEDIDHIIAYVETLKE